MSPAHDPPRTIAERFEIRGRLGEGGMGEVLEAFDTRLRRTVAVKRLPRELAADESYRRRLLTEARTAASLMHPGIAALHDVVEDDGEIYLVMERVQGQTLRQRMAESLRFDEFLDVAIETASALAAAHRAGIVHGDVKPGNIMVTPDGTVKVLDFGVARRTASPDEDPDAATLSTLAELTTGGTVAYMAPEILLGRDSDHRADIFSLGTTFYEVLTGTHPFAAATATAVSDRILHEVQPPVSGARRGAWPEIDAMVAKMLAKDPAERYATTDDLVVDLRKLRALVTGTEISHSAAPPWSTTRLHWRRWGTVAAAVAVLAVTALAWSTGIVGRWRDAPADPAAVAPAAFRATDWIIAVLPAHEADTGDPDMAALDEGLAATLTAKLTKLSRSHELQVVPASTLRSEGVRDVDSAFHELGITLVLDFDVHRFGETIRVNANLVNAREKRQLDAATVDGDAADMITLQERVAREVLEMLRLELAPVEERVLGVGTEEPRAYDYYLRGVGYLEDTLDGDKIETAAELLEQALRIDPSFAAAHAALGTAYWHRYRHGDDPSWVERASEECTEAIELDGLSADGYICLGLVRNGTGRYDEAARAYANATRLDPTSDAAYRGLGRAYEASGQVGLAEEAYREAISMRPHFWVGYRRLALFYFFQGRLDEATRQMEEVVRLAPDSFSGFSDLGAFYYYAGNWGEARRAFERAIEIKPDYDASYTNLGTVLFFEGEYRQAASAFETAVGLNGSDYVHWGNLADAYTLLPDESDRAEAMYRHAISLAERALGVNPNDGETHGDLALYAATLGERDRALRHAERALELSGGNMAVLHQVALAYERLGMRNEALEKLAAAIAAGYSRDEIEVNPFLADLRRDPRYARLAAAHDDEADGPSDE